MSALSRTFVLCALVGVLSGASALPAAQTPAQTPGQTPARPRLDQVKAATARIRAEDVLRDVSDLASDANMGRRTPFPGSPSPGYDNAANYVARHLRELGVKPMGDDGTYFQHYTVTRATLDTARVTGAIGGEQLKFGDDFIINNFLQPGVREANVIYVGNGVRLLKQGVDPYAGFDVRGKWLLVNAPVGGIVRGVGVNAQQMGVVGIDYTTVNEVARHGGALGILLVPTQAMLTDWNPRVVTGQDLNPSVGVAYAQFQVPRVILSVAGLKRLLDGTPLSADALLNADATKTYPPSVDLGARKRVRIDFAATILEARPYNVVGMLEGSDPRLKEEWISLAAHLDGAVPQAASVPGNNQPDQYNAADDNASGSAGNMAIVRALVAAPRPKRSILLIWDSGEEVGLWGTRAIAYGPWSEKIVLHVSNDMIGRSRTADTAATENLSPADTIYVTGPKLLSTQAEAVLQQASREFPFIKLDRVYEDVSSEFYYPRTDAGPYLERGIPIMQFFNGIHPEYHRPTDEVDKLDINKIVNVSKLSFGALWLAADDTERPRWDGILPQTLWWVKPRK